MQRYLGRKFVMSLEASTALIAIPILGAAAATTEMFREADEKTPVK